MIYLPLPWDEELLSSTLARGGRYFGKSIRQISWAHFGDFSPCHPMFPKYVPLFAAHWAEPWTTEYLITHNTFYPLLAPFAEEALRERLLGRMRGESRRISGRILHGMQLKTHRFCPACWRLQEAARGRDLGWLRAWQIPQSRICLRHWTPLMELDELFRDEKGVIRNLNARDVDVSRATPMNVAKRDWLLSVTAGELLHRPLMNLPSEAQWTLFWDRLLKGATNRELARRGRRYWGGQWLASNGVADTDRLLIKGARRRIWWRNLLLLKAAMPEASLLEAIDEAASLDAEDKA